MTEGILPAMICRSKNTCFLWLAFQNALPKSEQVWVQIECGSIPGAVSPDSNRFFQLFRPNAVQFGR